jgi:hypothetical protein
MRAAWSFHLDWGRPSRLQTAPLGPGAVADLDWKIVGTGLRAAAL